MRRQPDVEAVVDARGCEAHAAGTLGGRADAKQLIDLGVSVKMFTGDVLAVASESARGVGLTSIRRMADLKSAATAAG